MTEQIPLVRGTRRAVLARPVDEERCPHYGIVSTMNAEGEFRAVETCYELDDDVLRLPHETMDVLGAKPDTDAGCTPTEKPEDGPRGKPGSRRKVGA